jgi:His/Glu/Gln/Arg/opine family amino acid ABC transporter permease subunit
MSYTFQFDLNAQDWEMLFKGALRTMMYSFGGMILGQSIGIIIATWRNSQNLLLRTIASFYVEFVRNTTLLIQIFLIYFGLPSIGLRLNADQAAVIALVFNFGAYAAEIVRAGIEAVPRNRSAPGWQPNPSTGYEAQFADRRETCSAARIDGSRSPCRPVVRRHRTPSADDARSRVGRRALPFFSQDILQHCLVQRQIRHNPL